MTRLRSALADARARFEQSLGGEILDEVLRVEVVERALALASKLFVAVIPLSIIVKAIAPGSGNFGEDIVLRLGLTGAGAKATRALFATGPEVQGAVSVIGIVIVLYSTLSFTRALQRVYLKTWRLHAPTFDSLRRQLSWMAGFVAYTVLLAPIHDFEHRNNLGTVYGITAIALGAAFWGWTPYLLLGRQLSRRRLLPTGILTAAGISVYSIGTAIFLPEIFTHNAERYGLIGIAFSLVTWLFAYSGVVVACAVVAATWDRYRSRQTPSSAATSPPATASARRS
jgi:membrane protein